MIPVMLCTLTIGTVLPEPPAYAVEVQLLEWELAGAVNGVAVTSDEVPLHARVVGVKSMLLAAVLKGSHDGLNVFKFDSVSAAVINAYAQTGSARIASSFLGLHQPVRGADCIAAENEFELTRHGSFTQILSLQDRNRAFVIRIRRVK